MDIRLLPLIADYQYAVAAQWERLRLHLGIAAPKSDVEWSTCDIPGRGRFSKDGEYFKHGFGCMIKYMDGVVDFDFGRAGEIDGFDASRLWDFAESCKRTYGFNGFMDVEAVIKKAAADGELRFSGYILYYLNASKS